MGAAGAVEEVEVGEDGLAVAAQADGHAPLHGVEEQGLVAVEAGRARRTSWPGRGRDEDLGLDPGDADVGGVGDRGRHHARLR